MAGEESLERLQRILSAAGVSSRRAAEQYILDGRVSVNGKVVNQLGAKADLSVDEIKVDGKPLRPQTPRYVMLNKPHGYIATTSDERGRRTVMDLVPARERLYPVGRLDRDTEGLLLLTNDGLVAHRIMHPSFGLEKEYEVLTPAPPPAQVLAHLRAGVQIENRLVTPSEARVLRQTDRGAILRVTLHEGMNHVVRRMMDALEIQVISLTRTRVGPLTVRGLPVGAHRDLRAGELGSLFEALNIDDETSLSPASDIKTSTGTDTRRKPRTQRGRP